eukprot:gnl/Dysnectes_brevis/6498_a10119_403.p1 GENE.gnl/Dysnectes_brevis/6498_a10119_403~~gnl/Dysnectes_brevis/6498_a10119_403.p1  ORF type:complete len:208 (-),score=12.51 gnl/Dysnectes_brevis/6498_a10119_403:27-650(-)
MSTTDQELAPFVVEPLPTTTDIIMQEEISSENDDDVIERPFFLIKSPINDVNASLLERETEAHGFYTWGGFTKPHELNVLADMDKDDYGVLVHTQSRYDGAVAIFQVVAPPEPHLHSNPDGELCIIPGCGKPGLKIKCKFIRNLSRRISLRELRAYAQYLRDGETHPLLADVPALDLRKRRRVSVLTPHQFHGLVGLEDEEEPLIEQ